MKQVKIALYHDGCWGSEVTKSFLGVRFKQLTMHYRVLKKTPKFIRSQGLWEVTAPDSTALNRCLGALANHESILKMEIVSEEDTRAVVFLKWEVPHSPYEAFTRVGCIPLEPVLIENGIEYHSFLSENDRMLREAVREITKKSDSKILKIGRFTEINSSPKLTRKQESAITAAIDHGYYSWPRKATLEELATLSGVSRVTFQNHLRKAESKMLPRLITGIRPG